MPLELVTHTQTFIDSLWEINMATEPASWIQIQQVRHTNPTTAAIIISEPREVLSIMWSVLLQDKL